MNQTAASLTVQFASDRPIPYMLAEDADQPIPYTLEEPVEFCESFVVDDDALQAVAAE